MQAVITAVIKNNNNRNRSLYSDKYPAEYGSAASGEAGDPPQPPISIIRGGVQRLQQ